MASTTLNEIVLELQEQNRTLDDVKDGIRSMLREDIMMRKKEERAEGDKREAELEASAAKSKMQKGNKGPATSFKSGLTSGLGLDGILDGVSSFGIGLGGASIGGLIGTALGRLFLPAVGAILGEAYLDEWIGPLVDKITGDDATWTMFGQEIDASKIVSGFAGALGLMFGPKLLAGAVTSWFEKDAVTKGGALRRTFLRRLGLTAILLTAGQFAGDWLQGQGASPEFSDNVGGALTAAGVGLQLFGVKGALIAAFGYLAYKGIASMADWLKSKGDKFQTAMVEELERKNKEIDAALEAGEIQKAAELARGNVTKLQRMEELYKYGRSAIDEDKYIAMKVAAGERLKAAALASGDTGLGDQAAKQQEDVAKLSNIDDPNKIQELIKDRAVLTKTNETDAALQTMVNTSKGLIATDAAKEAAKQAVDLYMLEYAMQQYAESRSKAPKTPVQYGSPTVTTVDVGAKFTPNVLPKPGTTGFSLTDMFGSGNSFTNAKPGNVVIGNIDNSTTVVGGGQQSAKPISNAGSYGHAINTGYIEKRVLGGGGLFMIPGSIGIMPSS